MKKKIKRKRTCIGCANAYLMRSQPHNPIVAECSVTHQREMADTTRECEGFKPKFGEIKIHPMIPCEMI